MKISFDRKVLSKLAAAAVLGAVVSTSSLAAAEMRVIKIGIPGRTIDISYPWLSMPIALGWWRDKGYDVQLIPVGGSVEGMQQMAAGNLDFVEMNANIVVSANVTNNLPVRIVMQNGVIDWGVAVLNGGPIHDVKDFRDQKVGVFTLATGGIPYLKSWLRQNGLNPDEDVGLIAVGAGGPALQALKSQRVQGLLFWGTALAGYQNDMPDLRILRSPEWKSYPDFSLATMQATIDRDPALVTEIALEAVRASIFTVANPDCVRRVQWQRWPDTKPSGSDDEAKLAAWDRNKLDAQLMAMQQAFANGGGRLWGIAQPAAFERLENFMKETNLIDKTLPADQIIIHTPGFFETVNQVDTAAVQQQAKVCAFAP
jgi:NitT/TauT family transport system substrate-binding protein